MNGHTILVVGFSRVVLAILKRAVADGTHFSVIVTEGRPTESGIKMAKALLVAGIPTTVIMDAGVAHCMER